MRTEIQITCDNNKTVEAKLSGESYTLILMLADTAARVIVDNKREEVSLVDAVAEFAEIVYRRSLGTHTTAKEEI